MLNIIMYNCINLGVYSGINFWGGGIKLNNAINIKIIISKYKWRIKNKFDQVKSFANEWLLNPILCQ